MDITEDPLLQEFLDRNLRETTRVKYQTILNHYTKSTGLTPTELIEQAEDDEDNRVRLRKRRIKKHMENHLTYMAEHDFSPIYKQTSITCIRTFYHHFDIQLPKLNKNKEEKERLTTDDIPNREEIRRAMAEANTKFKAIILLQISSGMGLSEVTSLKIKDLLQGCKLDPTDIDQLAEIDRENTIIEWTVIRKKTGHQYWTFSTPETTGRIMDYLDQHPPGSVDEHIFRAHRGLYAGNEIKAISVPQYFIDVNDKCGFGRVGRLRKFRSHALRKYFANTLESHNCPHLAIRMMMGHKVGDNVTEAYFLPDHKRLLTEYRKVMEFLTIYENLKVFDNTEDIVREQDKTIEMLREDLELLKRHVEQRESIGKK
jgi:integrase